MLEVAAEHGMTLRHVYRGGYDLVLFPIAIRSLSVDYFIVAQGDTLFTGKICARVSVTLDQEKCCVVWRAWVGDGSLPLDKQLKPQINIYDGITVGDGFSCESSMLSSLISYLKRGCV
jgi:hypothetical protein